MILRLVEAQRTLGWRILWVAPWWLIRQKHLVLVRDLRGPLPPLPVKNKIRETLLAPEAVCELSALNPRMTNTEASRMLAEGQECHLYWIGKTPVHYRWETRQPTYLPYIGRTVNLFEGDVFGTDVYTHSKFRGQGIASAACLMAFHRMRRQGLTRSIVSIAWWNHPSLRAERDKGGRIVVGSIGFWNLGPWTSHFTEGGVCLDGSDGFYVCPRSNMPTFRK